ncbi:MAG: DeoR/GlpR family DNA-binding transcription regulator [Azospirillaceae bacterium]|nr:DeoR/GlpR family DNA-binding transcription regulator [Azospirillaceae bacterium]
MVSLKAAMRHQIILAALGERGQASVSELVERLGVSGVTVREDLRILEADHQLVRSRGGALARDDNHPEQPLETTRKANVAAKRAIGAAAAALVSKGQKIIVDVGSTTTALAEALPPSATDVTVITNAINIALLLERKGGCTIVVTGGTLRPLQHSLVAPLGTLLLERLNADVAFLGCNGVNARQGFTNSNLAEAEIKQAMIASAGRIVFLADHTKLGAAAAAFVARLGQVDLLITDDGADPRMLAELRNAGLEVMVAPRLP